MDSSDRSKTNRMGTERVAPLLIKMSLPVMASMLVMAMYNIVDSIFVSRVSESALTSVSLAFPFQMLIPAVGVGTGVGVSSLIARRLGEKRIDDAVFTATTGQFLSLISSVVMTLFLVLLARPMLSFFSDDSGILDNAVTYLTICGGFCVFPIFQIITEKTLQATGDMVRPMLVQLAGAIANLILDPIMIFGYLGFPAMGVAGAAIATVTGQGIGMALGFYFLLRPGMPVKPRFRGFRPKAEVVVDIYRVGFPSILMQAINSFANIWLNKILIVITPTAVSVLGVYFKLQSFIFMPVFGLNSGAMPIMAYNYGAGDKKRLMEALRAGVIYALIIMLTGLALFQLIPDVFMRMFDASDEMTEIGVKALRIISLCFPLAALSIMFSTLFQAVGRGMLSLIVTLFRQIAALLPAAYLLAKLAGGLPAVWYSFPAAEAVGLVAATIMLIRVYSDNVKRLQPREAEK